MNSKKPNEGGCFCGAVRYQILNKPIFINCCHCTDCQKQTGSAFVINAIIETSNIKKLKGSVECIIMSKKDDSPHDIYRCKKCKTALWSDYGRRPLMRFLRVSTLDQSKRYRPNAHIFTRSKLPWVHLEDDIPAFEIYYDMETLWPKKSIQRRLALI